MRLILRYLKQNKGLFFLNLVAVSTFALVELAIPTITGWMINDGILNEELKLLTQLGLLLGALAIIGGLGNVFLGFTSSKIAPI